SRGGRVVAAARSHALGAHPAPQRGAADGLAREDRERPGRSGLSPIARRIGGGQAGGGSDTSLVSTKISPGAPYLRRLFLHGVHVERSAPDLFGRARQRGRRSAQGGQRSRRAGDRRGITLPAGLFSPGDRPERSATSALSLQRSRTIARHTGASAERRVAAPG